MTSERHALIKQIFLEVCRASPDRRAELLDQHCGDDHDLRHEVEKLVAHHTVEAPARKPQTDAEQFATGHESPKADGLEVGAGPSGDFGGLDSLPGDVCGFQPGAMVADRYRIVSLLGHGGMGEVYRAEDLTLHQTVALKFLLPGMGANPMWLARFNSEVRFARQVTHPHVCRVYDWGRARAATSSPWSTSMVRILRLC